MTELNISLPPPKDSPDFDGWLVQVAQYLRDYLGATISYNDLDDLPTYVNFVDRGDPGDVDFTISDLTTDGTWKTGANALDFSSIVPSGAKAMLLYVAVSDDSVSTHLIFRKSGQSNDLNIGKVITQVSGVWITNDSMIIPCSTDRKVEYYGTNTTVNDAFIVVKGWWI